MYLKGIQHRCLGAKADCLGPLFGGRRGKKGSAEAGAGTCMTLSRRLGRRHCSPSAIDAVTDLLRRSSNTALPHGHGSKPYRINDDLKGETNEQASATTKQQAALPSFERARKHQALGFSAQTRSERTATQSHFRIGPGGNGHRSDQQDLRR